MRMLARREARRAAVGRGPQRIMSTLQDVPEIVILIALQEEYEYAREALEARLGSLEQVEHTILGGSYLRCHYHSPQGTSVRLLTILIGRGPERAAANTAAFLATSKAEIVVNIGISGSLKPDALLLDVVVADQVTSYLANAKATGSAGGMGFTLEPGGEAFRPDNLLAERCSQLSIERSDLVSSWQARNLVRMKALVPADALKHLMDRNLVRLTPRVVKGPIAAGPVVGATEAFRNWLLGMKRDLIAVDMESSGVFTAVDCLAGKRKGRMMVLRAISDFADERKNALEEHTKGSIRQVAIGSAVSLLLAFLDTLPTYVLTGGQAD